MTTYLKKKNGNLSTGMQTWRKPGTEQEILLLGAIHVAHPNYWHDINSILRRYADIGWELHLEKILPLDNKDGLSTAQLDALGELDSMKEIQDYMRNAMQLEGQKESLASLYDLHGSKDLSMRQMLEYVSKDYDSKGTNLKMLENIRKEGDNKDIKLWSGRIFLWSVKNLPWLQHILPFIGKSDGGLSMFPKEAVIDRRNEHAIGEALRSDNNKRVLFWGAAHLPGMAKLLRKNGFVPAGTPTWIVAIPKEHKVV